MCNIISKYDKYYTRRSILPHNLFFKNESNLNNLIIVFFYFYIFIFVTSVKDLCIMYTINFLFLYGNYNFCFIVLSIKKFYILFVRFNKLKILA